MSSVYFFFFASVAVFLAAGVASEDEVDEVVEVLPGLKQFLEVKYKLFSSDDKMDAVFKALGTSDKAIQNAKDKKPSIKLSFDDITGKYTLERYGGGFSDFELTFSMGPVLRMYFGDKVVEMTMSSKENVITEQLAWTHSDVRATIDYEFFPSELKVKYSVGGVQGVQLFKKV